MHPAGGALSQPSNPAKTFREKKCTRDPVEAFDFGYRMQKPELPMTDRIRI